MLDISDIRRLNDAKQRGYDDAVQGLKPCHRFRTRDEQDRYDEGYRHGREFAEAELGHEHGKMIFAVCIVALIVIGAVANAVYAYLAQ